MTASEQLKAVGFNYLSADHCPDKARLHTKNPAGYPAWHEWAEKKALTHDCQRCPTCGYWTVWVPKS